MGNTGMKRAGSRVMHCPFLPLPGYFRQEPRSPRQGEQPRCLRASLPSHSRNIADLPEEEGNKNKKATFHKSPAYVSKHQPQGGLWRQQEKNLLGALKAQPLAYPTVCESQKKRKCIAYEITAGMVVIVGDCNALAFCSAYQTQPTSSIWYHGESFPPAVPVWVNHLQMIHKICSKSGKQKISPKKASFTIIRDVRATFPLLMLSPASHGSWPSLFTSSFWDIQL